tara:strand:- start:665 stop:2140 length:1476 start_codon:yes stop_codon:yes gene_type:complete
MKKITIIGSGLSGIAASCYLANNNYDVTVIEKNETPGGRLSFFEDNGFIFDMGPSWYWMPEVFENFFKDFGREIDDYYKLKRLDPSYKFFFPDSEINIPANLDSLYSLFEKKEPGAASQLEKFIYEAKSKYDISMKHFIYLSNNKYNSYLSPKILKYLFSLDLFKSLRKHIDSFFKNKQLKEILEFPSMFLGGSPNNTPALYSLMNYGDIVGGTWYPIGGMYEVTKGFYKLSKELGVNYILNEEISGFNIDNGKIISAKSKNNKSYFSDLYICCAEYPFVQMQLLDKKYRTYKSKYWSKKNIAPSALIFYLGLSKKINNLEHHNLFFDENFEEHLNDIFEKNLWPENPLFYVCCPSKTDASVVPDQTKENLFILVPIGAGSIDSNEIREKTFNKIIQRFEEKTKQEISNKIISKTSFCVNDFKIRYNAYKGNAYGLANTLFQTAIFKPKIKDKKINNLYYSGHFTVPGPGLPPAVISGNIVANEIINEDRT